MSVRMMMKNGGKSLLTGVLLHLLVSEFCFAEIGDSRTTESPGKSQSDHQQNENIDFSGATHKTSVTSDVSAEEEDEESVIRKLAAFRERKKQVRSATSASQSDTAPESDFEKERRRIEAAEKAARDVSVKY
jgi:hypothetical protein